jgi:hypothetical protein
MPARTHLCLIHEKLSPLLAARAYLSFCCAESCRVERSTESGEWSETLVARAAPQPQQGAHLPSSAADAQLREVLRPASDPLILRCLEALESGPRSGGDGGGGSCVRQQLARAWGWLLGGGGGEVRWLPTGCLRLLGTLCQVGGAPHSNAHVVVGNLLIDELLDFNASCVGGCPCDAVAAELRPVWDGLATPCTRSRCRALQHSSACCIRSPHMLARRRRAQVRPAHTLIAADFTQLPEVAVGGAGAPLVATTVRACSGRGGVASGGLLRDVGAC